MDASNGIKETIVVDEIMKIRKDHPMMGLKKMYIMLEAPVVGRDTFMKIGIEHKLGGFVPKSKHRTTYSVKSSRYDNLLMDAVFDDINQVCSTDITYFRINEVYYYIDFIMDIYSRRIIGYNVSDSLRAESCVTALKMAIKTRGKQNMEGMIHHSDKGTQYVYNTYTDLLEKELKMKISMCNIVYENTHIERLNGIAKNEYLIPRGITTFKQLQKELTRFVKLYNEKRPHLALNGLTPIKYEERLKTLPKCQRTKLICYIDDFTRLSQTKNDVIYDS